MHIYVGSLQDYVHSTYMCHLLNFYICVSSTTFCKRVSSTTFYICVPSHMKYIFYRKRWCTQKAFKSTFSWIVEKKYSRKGNRTTQDKEGQGIFIRPLNTPAGFEPAPQLFQTCSLCKLAGHGCHGHVQWTLRWKNFEWKNQIRKNNFVLS
jgi:hypothetical protein